MALNKLCRCGKVIPYHLDRCEECQGKYDVEKKAKYKEYQARRKDKEVQAIYNGTTWKRVRKMALVKANGLCERCLDMNEITYADEVHHIKPIKDGGNPYKLTNLMCVCRSCHKVLHEEIDNKKKRIGLI